MYPITPWMACQPASLPGRADLSPAAGQPAGQLGWLAAGWLAGWPAGHPGVPRVPGYGGYPGYQGTQGTLPYPRYPGYTPRPSDYTTVPAQDPRKRGSSAAPRIRRLRHSDPDLQSGSSLLSCRIASPVDHWRLRPAASGRPTLPMIRAQTSSHVCVPDLGLGPCQGPAQV